MSEETQDTGAQGAGEQSNTDAPNGVTNVAQGPVDPMAGKSVADVAAEPAAAPTAESVSAASPAPSTPSPVQTRESLDKALAELDPAEYAHQGVDYVVDGMRKFFGELFTLHDEAKVHQIFRGPSTDTPIAQGDVAAQNAPADPVPPPGLHLMDRLQALPELAKEEAAHLVSQGIQAFKDVDRRTMRVVHRLGEYFKQEVWHGE